MSVWKSPVLYLGVLLVLAVAGLLLAPFVYDWSSYRPQLEAWGRKLTGREVKIAGGIEVRLFPWPRLTADDVHVANPAGMAAPDFASAERVTVALQAASLLSGNIQVQSIDIERPTLSLERQADGTGNWTFQPAAGVLGTDMARRVRLDRITLTDAVVHLKDDRRGTGDVALTVPRATLMAPELVGPWRAAADEVAWNGQTFAANVTTGTYAPDAPLRFTLTLRPAAGSFGGFRYAAAFDGQASDGKLSGGLRLDPLADPSGKGDAEGTIRPLAIAARLDGDFDKLALDDIQVSPADPSQGGTLLTGAAQVTLGKRIAANADLAANKLDLADFAGAGLYDAMRQGGVLAGADALLAMLPENVNLTGGLKVTALQAGPETLENIALKLDASREAIRVKELSAGLPGRSRALFDGVFFPGKEGAELAGNLALEANDLRQFTGWLWPAVKPQAERLWTGSRGHFKLQSRVNVTEDAAKLSKAQYELDGAPGTFDLNIVSGGRGAVELRLDSPRLDLDNLAGGGIAALAHDGEAGLSSLLAALLPQRGSPDLRLVVQTDEMLLNGVTAKDVTLDAAAGGNGLDLKTLELSAGGAKLQASGLVLDSGKGPDGAVGLDIAADDPRGLLRLAGIVTGDRDPDWANALGKTAMKATVSVKAGATSPTLGVDANGTSGDFTFTASGNLAPGEARGLGGTLDLKARTSAALARLAGLTAAADDQSPADVKLTLETAPKGGYLADVQAQAFAAQASFNGTVAAPAALAAGKLSLRSTDISTLAAATGYPAADLPRSLLVLDAEVGGDARSVTLYNLDGRLGAAPISGGLALAAGPKLTGKLLIGDLSLGDLLPPVFLAWYGTAPSLESTFAARAPFGLTGEIWLTPRSLTIGDSFTARDVQVGLTADGNEIHLALFGKDEGGRDAAIEIASKGSDADRALEGKLTLPVDLARQLKLAGGGPVAEGQGTIDFHFDAVGRSPGGALAGLKGAGDYSFDGLRFTNVSPADFAKALANTKDAAGLNAAFDALRGSGGLAVPAARGAITAENGVATFQPIAVKTSDADMQVKAGADLGAGQVNIDVGLDFKTQAGLPHMDVTYAGPPGALARNEDKSALAAKLGIAIMQQGVTELEKLQQEQQLLAQQEEAQRREDEAKLAAYYAQRDELLLRKRELKVFSEMRLAAAEKLRAAIEAERPADIEINRSELVQRRREIRVYRRLASGDGATPFAIEVVQKPKPAAAPKLIKPAPAAPPVALPPPGQPLVIVPPAAMQNGAAPSQ